MRLFISIKIPEKIKKTLSYSIKEIYNKNYFIGKIVEKENLHLTLKFLGEFGEEKIEKIIKLLDEVKENKISVMVGNLGVFDEKSLKIIWVKLFGVDELQEKIDESLSEIFEKEKRFMSHITLARVKSVKEKKSLIDEIKNFKFSNLIFNAESFELMSSELKSSGAEYKIVRSFNLLN